MMKTLPITVTKYKCTPDFTEKSVPRGLMANHSTKADVWGVIRIKSGQLEYVIRNEEFHVLEADNPGIFEPTVRHFIKPIGTVKFCVEFYK